MRQCVLGEANKIDNEWIGSHKEGGGTRSSETIVAAVASSSSSASTSVVAQPWTNRNLHVISKRSHRSTTSFSGRRSSFRRLKLRPRAALVEVTPNAVVPAAPRDGSSAKVLALPADRADDIQAEARAMARSANASVYSPKLLADKYGSQPFKVVGRTLQILTALGSFGLKLFLDQSYSQPFKVVGRTLQILAALGSFGLKLFLDQRNGVLDRNKRVRAVELRTIFTQLGPTFVKLGQGLSTRPDICPPEYLEELSELQDGLPTFPDEEAFACFERELGLSLESIFSSISPSPIAAASLGQVYKAQLKYSGKLVAVKVQRPGIEEAIGLDFFLIRGLGFFINKYVDIITSDVVALIDEFARRVFQVLNYVQNHSQPSTTCLASGWNAGIYDSSSLCLKLNFPEREGGGFLPEGQNARKFRKLYADKEDIFVPDVFWDYTSAKVLTMDWVSGVKLNEQEAIERQGLKVLDLVNTGIQCSLRQLLEYGYFHADPHPGNLLATPEGKLAFLDFGMMSETPEEARFLQEGQNARKFRKLYAGKEDIFVPDVFWDYTSAKVLTMDWVSGVKLNEQEAIERQGLKVLDLVNTGIQCSLRQLLEYGYFHADPHPGNLLATPEGKLAFLDFGMMSETPEDARFAIIGHVVHLVNRDYEAMSRDYYALDFLASDVDVSPIVPALRDFFDDALNYTVSELNFKTLVDGLGNVLYQYPFNVPAYYVLILRSLTVLEGLALYADPNFKVLAASYPYFAKRLLTDPNPYLRDALIELLFKDGKFSAGGVDLRLENLLVQGRMDREFSAKEALQPVLKVLLSPDGEELRQLVTKEAIRVT
ncbi:protein ACTIVITY OF BC1 COMPLEX KINASE 3, chloroplastic-like [Senna tora]|uniref:Protein ACTIVITY OF BC1 COMPLEX KINASE 3, chloroplastic-like n=1 Tax=Senna tora TaxID=362788 RepID=A0A834XJ99_9FABA|nr:protein ACTIVITY OF BC1 COMPLEX KINASE 3, chloroplastic-like [Senna tora]